MRFASSRSPSFLSRSVVCRAAIFSRGIAREPNDLRIFHIPQSGALCVQFEQHGLHRPATLRVRRRGIGAYYVNGLAHCVAVSQGCQQATGVAHALILVPRRCRVLQGESGTAKHDRVSGSDAPCEWHQHARAHRGPLCSGRRAPAASAAAGCAVVVLPAAFCAAVEAMSARIAAVDRTLESSKRLGVLPFAGGRGKKIGAAGCRPGCGKFPRGCRSGAPSAGSS